MLCHKSSAYRLHFTAKGIKEIAFLAHLHHSAAPFPRSAPPARASASRRLSLRDLGRLQAAKFQSHACDGEGVSYCTLATSKAPTPPSGRPVNALATVSRRERIDQWNATQGQYDPLQHEVDPLSWAAWATYVLVSLQWCRIGKCTCACKMNRGLD